MPAGALLALFWLADPAQAAPCLLPELGQPPPLRVPESRSLDGAKTERDAWGSYPNSLASDNFIAKWGSSGGVTDDEVTALLDAFEAAWAVEIEAMAHPGPAGSDTTLFNVYIGDTGDGAPSGYGAGGYYWTDDEGWPMVVVARDSLYDTGYADVVAAHEFYHAVQGSLGTFPYSGSSAWYWEATADWAAGEVFPDNPDYAVFLFGYAFLPHLPLDYFDYPDSGALQEYHQYGAFIFPRYLTEQVADWTLVRDSWVEPGEADPLDALDAGLVARGSSIAAVFPAYAAHNATWDYEDGETYEEMLAAYEIWYASGDHRIAAEVGPEGTGGEVEAVEELLPQRYGYNVIRLMAPDEGPLVAAFAGDLAGSEGSDARFGVTVVVASGDGVAYTPVPLADNTGEVTVDVPADASALYLVVAAWSDALANGETFDYRYRLEPGDSVVPPDDTSTPDDTGQPYVEDDPKVGGCCATASAGGAPPVGLAALLFLFTRLRGRRRSSRPA